MGHLTDVITFKQMISDLTTAASETIRNGRPAIEDPMIRQKLAQCAIEIEIVVLNGYRTLSNQIKGRDPGPEEQMGKIFWSEMYVRLTELAKEILGPECSLDTSDPVLKNWQYSFLTAKGALIAMGTSEILRNVIGGRVLGLPR